MNNIGTELNKYIKTYFHLDAKELPDVAEWKRASLQKDKHPQSAALP